MGAGNGNGGASTELLILIACIIVLIIIIIVGAYIYKSKKSMKKNKSKVFPQNTKTVAGDEHVGLIDSHSTTSSYDHLPAFAAPPPGSAYESYINASADSAEAAVMFSAQHPPPVNTVASNIDLEAVKCDPIGAYRFNANAYVGGTVIDNDGFFVTFTQNQPGQSRTDRCCLSEHPLVVHDASKSYAYFEVSVCRYYITSRTWH